MPHIDLPEDRYGMRSLIEYRPDTGAAILQLAHAVLQGDSPISAGEREAIAAHVAALNACTYCSTIHGASAAEHLACDIQALKDGLANPEAIGSPKFPVLLKVAGEIARGGKELQASTVKEAREAGVTDRELHDVVLAAALMCMATRYVDGLATALPGNLQALEEAGRAIARNGYVPPSA